MGSAWHRIHTDALARRLVWGDDRGMSEILQQAVLAFMLLTMMFAMGLRLTVADLRRALMDRTVVIACIAVNFLVLPLFALMLVKFFGLSPDASAGFLLCAAAPGATMTTLLSRNTRADVPMAVGLLLLLVILSAFLTPLIAKWLFVQAGLSSASMNAVGAVLYLLSIQIVPLALGMVVRANAPERAERWEAKVSRLATIVLLVVIVGMTAANFGIAKEIGAAGFGAMAAFMVVATGAGVLVPRPPPARVACAFAFGAQNIALATLLAERYLAKEALIVVLMFGLVTYLVLLPLVPVFRRWIERTSPEN